MSSSDGLPCTPLNPTRQGESSAPTGKNAWDKKKKEASKTVINI